MRPILCGGKEEEERYCPRPRNKGGSDDNDGFKERRPNPAERRAPIKRGEWSHAPRGKSFSKDKAKMSFIS